MRRVAQWKRDNPDRSRGRRLGSVLPGKTFRIPEPKGDYETVKNVPDNVPKPGHVDAKKLGCLCNVVTNNHGMWAPFPPDEWWVSSKCPIHNVEKEKK